ncbi:hypothetical protein C8J56DRAFT_1024154 [Mycena floridula]|nr:hypothetical protein C8J56DRAFT_1034675 [Mycena floridula]KAJ7591693.1 hypothetical protein C8J56DRAFT_1024154 [Mycena floridula]
MSPSYQRGHFADQAGYLSSSFRCSRSNIISSSRLFAPIPPMVLFPFSLAFATIYVDVAMVKKKMKEANVSRHDGSITVTDKSPSISSPVLSCLRHQNHQAHHIRDIVHEPAEL